ncbi:MAG: acetyl-CoA carboxylase biotin carboxyl carrier protein [Solirubrobacteraceae bacterium]|nr:acetyl-CoA carboxylase biotin carboxyl carrier protein [Solirubrobacteraceae bacterium]
MPAPKRPTPTADEALLQAVWAEARDLVKRLEGSSVQRLAVSAGDCSIEIERGAPAPAPGGGGFAPDPAFTSRALSGPIALGGAGGLGVAAGARAASGAFTMNMDAVDNRIPVLAPLVGTFYEAATPGAKAFAAVGDTVEPGQTVCIVEAMKLMNEVAAGEGGKVAEILVKNGDPVEFEQVLMYLESADE